LRVKPDFAEAFADLLISKVLEINAKVLAVRKLGIVLSLSGKVRVDFDAVANVADKNKGGPAMRRRQRAGIILRLTLGVEHEHVPRTIRAPTAAGTRRELSRSVEPLAG
jgi:hypothetical protein